MKKLILFFLIVLSFINATAQDDNYDFQSVKSIDSIVRLIKNNNKQLRYKNIDSISTKFYWVDKKNKKLLAVEIFNHFYTPKKAKVRDYQRFIYYFHNEELIKLIVIYCTSKKDCKKGYFYFSNGNVIHKKDVLTDDFYLKKSLQFALDFKSFVSRKNGGG